MGDLLSLDKLTLFLIFVVPGFIAMKTYDLLVPAERRDFGSAIIDVITYSIINLAIFGWIIPLLFGWSLNWGSGYLYFVLFGAPVILSVVARLLRAIPLLKGWLIHPTPTGWDHFFGKGTPCWIVFHLKSGNIIGGFYSGESLASSFPRPQDIYVEQVWKLDEQYRFKERLDQTLGLIIRMDECEFIELYEEPTRNGEKDTEQ